MSVGQELWNALNFANLQDDEELFRDSLTIFLLSLAHSNSKKHIKLSTFLFLT